MVRASNTIDFEVMLSSRGRPIQAGAIATKLLVENLYVEN